MVAVHRTKQQKQLMELTKEQQFAQFVRQYKSTIYSICYMFSSDKDEVADLFQDILVRLWQGYDASRDKDTMNAWAYRVSMNMCISADRKRKSRGERIPLSVDIDLYTDQDDDTQQVKLLYNRIHRLGLVDRAIVMLWLENLSYEEIGQIIGISAKNVSVKLVRIKEQLKKS